MSRVFSQLGMAILYALIPAVYFYTPDALAFGDDLLVGDFSCSNGAATGQLLVSGASCPATLQISNVFSFLMCNIEQMSGNVFGNMYCGMISDLAPAVWAFTTLAVLFFGISFTIGVVPATGRDALSFLIKIALVTGFATNADLIIAYGYNFLIGGMKEGVEIVLTGMNVTGASTGYDAYSMFDGFLYGLFRMVTDSVGQTAPEKRCTNAVFAVIATLSAIFPIFAYLALLLVGRMLLTFFRAVFGYIYAIIGITFLLVLSPFFVPMYLFRTTQNFFSKWIGYLASFAIQIILLFSFIAFVLSMSKDMKGMIEYLPDVIMYHEEALEASAFRFPWQYCTLCDFDIVDKDNPSVKLSYADTKEFISKAKLQCKVYPINLPTSKDYSTPFTNSQGYVPISITQVTAPNAKDNQLNALLLLVGSGVTALIVLAVVISEILNLIPALAMRLASGLGAGNYAPQLGGRGESLNAVAPTLPGESILDNFKTGFNQGNSEIWNRSRDNFRSTLETRQGNPVSGGALKTDTRSADTLTKDGMRAMVTGKGRGDTPLYNETNMPGATAEEIRQRNEAAGYKNSWRNWLSGQFR